MKKDVTISKTKLKNKHTRNAIELRIQNEKLHRILLWSLIEIAITKKFKKKLKQNNMQLLFL